MFLTALIYH